MSQCHAVIERKNARCLNRAAFGSHYCRGHYPKEGILTVTLSGIFLGVCIVVVFHFTVGSFLERFRPFYHMDRTPPEVHSMIPDMRRFKNMDPRLRVFQIEAADSGSGMDWEKYSITLKKHWHGRAEQVPGKTQAKNPYLKFEAGQELDPGDYVLEASLRDRAGHEKHFLDSFTVTGSDLGFTVLRHPFEKDPHPERYEGLFDPSRAPQGSLFVYRIHVSHQAPAAAVLKNIKIQVELPGAILAFYEIGSSGTDRKDPFPLERRGFWKPKIFSDRKWIEIGELDPHGMIVFSVLVKHPEAEVLTDTAFPFSGSYDYQSYQHSGPKNIAVWVPAINEEEK